MPILERLEDEASEFGGVSDGEGECYGDERSKN